MGDVPSRHEVSSVVRGRTRRPSASSRLMRRFIVGDSRETTEYLISDVLIPEVKDLIGDLFIQGFERMLFGTSRTRSRGYSGGAAARPSTSLMRGRESRDTSLARSPRREEATSAFSRSAAPFYEEKIFEFREDADAVAQGLSLILEKYDSATLADLRSLCGEPSKYTDQKRGWTDLTDLKVIRTRDGFLLRIPAPSTLD